MTANTISMNLKNEEENKEKISLICIKKLFIIGINFEEQVQIKTIYKFCATKYDYNFVQNYIWWFFLYMIKY